MINPDYHTPKRQNQVQPMQEPETKPHRSKITTSQSVEMIPDFHIVKRVVGNGGPMGLGVNTQGPFRKVSNHERPGSRQNSMSPVTRFDRPRYRSVAFDSKDFAHNFITARNRLEQTKNMIKESLAQGDSIMEKVMKQGVQSHRIMGFSSQGMKDQQNKAAKENYKKTLKYQAQGLINASDLSRQLTPKGIPGTPLTKSLSLNKK